MPARDRWGNQLNVGDEVIVKCFISEIFTEGEDSQICVETAYVPDTRGRQMVLAAKHVLRIPADIRRMLKWPNQQ